MTKDEEIEAVLDDSRFRFNQKNEILWGLDNGVDTSVYADPKYDWKQMNQIRLGLENGVDVSVYADTTFDWKQMEYVRRGLEQGLDVSLYADSQKFTSEQMFQIRYGLENGVDASVYADPKFNEYQMHEIREGLEHGVDVSVYVSPEFDAHQMSVIRGGLEKGLDVSKYADPKIDWWHMNDIHMQLYLCRGLECKPPISDYQKHLVERILEQRDGRIDANSSQFESVAAGLRDEMETLPLEELSDVLVECGADSIWVYEQVSDIRDSLQRIDAACASSLRDARDELGGLSAPRLGSCEPSELGLGSCAMLSQVCHNLSVGLDWDDGMVSVALPREKAVRVNDVVDVHGEERVYLSASVVVDEDFDEVDTTHQQSSLDV